MKNKIKLIKIDDVELTKENFNEITGSRASKSFEEFILDNISEHTIIEYAKWRFDMVEEDEVECDCPQLSLSDFDKREMAEDLKNDGFVVFEPTSITEQMSLEEHLLKLKT